jgi:glycosyltransferase involved in cell wall biosynthesis
MIPVVSILVPVYNVSKYIERCAHSLLMQSMANIEYVFVNDCTPDDSIEKLQKVITQYPPKNVKIIHHTKNRGSAAARDTAIKNSTGKYILFIDSDDWVEPDMVETMCRKAEEEQADIVVCDFMIEAAKETTVVSDFVPESKNDYFAYMLENKLCSGYLWNKLVDRDLYKRTGCCRIDGFNYLEDRYLCTLLYFYAQKIIKVDKVFYHYDRTNENSISCKKTKAHFENVVLFWNLIDLFLKEKNLYKKYEDLINQSKVENKIALLTQTNSYSLRKQYAYIFRDIEMKYFSQFRRGEKLILFFTHYRLYFLAQIIRWIIRIRNESVFSYIFTAHHSQAWIQPI